MKLLKFCEYENHHLCPFELSAKQPRQSRLKIIYLWIVFEIVINQCVIDPQPDSFNLQKTDVTDGYASFSFSLVFWLREFQTILEFYFWLLLLPLPILKKSQVSAQILNQIKQYMLKYLDFQKFSKFSKIFVLLVLFDFLPLLTFFCFCNFQHYTHFFVLSSPLCTYVTFQLFSALFCTFQHYYYFVKNF